MQPRRLISLLCTARCVAFASTRGRCLFTEHLVLRIKRAFAGRASQSQLPAVKLCGVLRIPAASVVADAPPGQELQPLFSRVTLDEIVNAIRRQSQGFARGSSAFRGVTKHPSGRFEARLGGGNGRCGASTRCHVIITTDLIYHRWQRRPHVSGPVRRGGGGRALLRRGVADHPRRTGGCCRDQLPAKRLCAVLRRRSLMASRTYAN